MLFWSQCLAWQTTNQTDSACTQGVSLPFYTVGSGQGTFVQDQSHVQSGYLQTDQACCSRLKLALRLSGVSCSVQVRAAGSTLPLIIPSLTILCRLPATKHSPGKLQQFWLTAVAITCSAFIPDLSCHTQSLHWSTALYGCRPATQIPLGLGAVTAYYNIPGETLLHIAILAFSFTACQQLSTKGVGCRQHI